MKHICTYASQLEELLHLVHALVYSIGRDADAVLKDKGITYSEFIVLLMMSTQEGPVTQQSIAESLGITGAAVNRTIHKLLAREMVQKEALGVHLTIGGRKVAEESKNELMNYLAERFATIQDEELTRTNNTLRVLLTLISKNN